MALKTIQCAEIDSRMLFSFISQFQRSRKGNKIANISVRKWLLKLFAMSEMSYGVLYQYSL